MKISEEGKRQRNKQKILTSSNEEWSDERSSKERKDSFQILVVFMIVRSITYWVNRCQNKRLISYDRRKQKKNDVYIIYMHTFTAFLSQF